MAQNYTHGTRPLIASNKGSTKAVLRRHTAITLAGSDPRYGIKHKVVPVTGAHATSCSPSSLDSDKEPEPDNGWIDVLDDVPGGMQTDPDSEDVRPKKRTRVHFKRVRQHVLLTWIVLIRSSRFPGIHWRHSSPSVTQSYTKC